MAESVENWALHLKQRVNIFSLTNIFGLRNLFLDSLQDGGGEHEGWDEVDVDLPHLAMGDLEVFRGTAVSDSHLGT